MPNVEIRPRLTLISATVFVKKRRHFDEKSRFLEILEIIIESFEDHFLELLEAPGSSSTSPISRKSSDLTATKKRRFNVTSDPLLTSVSQISLCWLYNGHPQQMVQSTPGWVIKQLWGEALSSSFLISLRGATRGDPGVSKNGSQSRVLYSSSLLNLEILEIIIESFEDHFFLEAL